MATVATEDRIVTSTPSPDHGDEFRDQGDRVMTVGDMVSRSSREPYMDTGSSRN